MMTGGHVAGLPPGPQEVEAAPVGQHQVEQDQIVDGQPDDSPASSSRFTQSTACPSAAIWSRTADAQDRVVLDQQHAHVGAASGTDLPAYDTKLTAG